MAEHSGIVHSGSADIFYTLHENGKEKTLVMLHGNGESSRRFEKHVPILSEHYNLLLIDSRGHGRSTPGGGDLSLGNMAVDLENVFDALKLDKVYLLGFSDGANIAMIFTPKNNTRIEKLVLVGGNLNYSGFTFSTKLLVAVGYYLSYISMKLDKRNKLNNSYYYLMFKEPNIRPADINKIEAETLVMAGDKDMIKRSHTDLICNSIKRGMLKIYTGDHFYIYKEPEAFCETVINFLNK